MSTFAATDAPMTDDALGLERAVDRALARTPCDLRTFLGELQGADPVTAMAALVRHRDGPHAHVVRALRAEAAITVPVGRSELPIAHPLDYAWLFAPATQADLIARITVATSPGDLVMYLGCPTLHERAVNQLADRRHLLFDRDERRVMIANARVPGSARRVDLLRDPITQADASLVVADPPWYPAAAGAFISAAAMLMRPAATLLLAFADRFTRPGAPEDLAQILRLALQNGLEPTAVEPGGCRYLMPPYERAALTAAGLPGIPEDWRRGALITMRRDGSRCSDRRTTEESCWRALEIDQIPLRVRGEAPAFGRGMLTPLLDGEILPSVSRRDPRRAQAALWTSRNRIYASADPPALARALADTAALGAHPALAAQLADVVEIERHEHGLPSQQPA